MCSCGANYVKNSHIYKTFLLFCGFGVAISHHGVPQARMDAKHDVCQKMAKLLAIMIVDSR
jgi:hypothetical protein